MKNRTKLPNIYLAVIFVMMYLPILLVIIYSFNQSKISSVWDGFSLKWYRELFADNAMFTALINSIILAFSSSVLAATIGTLGALGMAQANFKATRRRLCLSPAHGCHGSMACPQPTPPRRGG